MCVCTGMCHIAASPRRYRPRFGYLGVPCGTLWLHNEAVHDCYFFSVLTMMMSYVFLAIVAVCIVFCLCCFSHGLGVLSAGRRRPAFCTALGGRAERYLLGSPTVCISLVGLMCLIDIILVRFVYLRLYWHVPHRCIASAISATFRALWGTLRHPLAPQRGGA